MNKKNGVVLNSEEFHVVSEFNDVYQDLRYNIKNALGIEGRFTLPCGLVTLWGFDGANWIAICEGLQTMRDYIQASKVFKTFKLVTQKLVLKNQATKETTEAPEASDETTEADENNNDSQKGTNNMNKEIKNRVFNISSEIFNMNDFNYQVLKAYDESGEILEAFNFSDIPDLDSLQFIMHDVALVDSAEDYDEDAEDYDENEVVAVYWYDGTMQLNRIDKNSNLYSWLYNWYGSDEAMQKNIRGYYETPEALYFVHGIGYDALSADLLGGSADGVALKMFYDFINNKNTEDVYKFRYKLVNNLGF